MRKFLGLGLFFLISLVIALVFNMPLVHVLARVELPKEVRLGNFDGSLLNGKVDVVEVNRLQATGVEYQYVVDCLLSLQWCYHLDMDQGSANISANPLDQSLVISDSILSYPISEVLALGPPLLVNPTGEIEVEIERMSVKQRKVKLSSGLLTWKNAGVAGESIELGDYQLNARFSNGSYLLTIKDNNALLKVDGKGQLKSNGQYNLDIKIEGEPGLQNSIKTALEFVARKRGLNQYSVLQNGNVPQQVISQLSFEES